MTSKERFQYRHLYNQCLDLILTKPWAEDSTRNTYDALVKDMDRFIDTMSVAEMHTELVWAHQLLEGKSRL